MANSSYASELYEKMTGYTEEDLIGTYSLSNIYPDDREKVRNKAIQGLKTKNSERMNTGSSIRIMMSGGFWKRSRPSFIKVNEPHWKFYGYHRAETDGASPHPERGKVQGYS